METKKSLIDITAKELWNKIGELQDLLFNNIHDDASAQFYYDFYKKSSEYARYIDKNFYNNDSDNDIDYVQHFDND